jgi:uncharacterized protein (DUF2267 family)
MEDNFAKTAEQVAAFQKIWTESMTSMMQTAFGMAPNSAPPEVLRQIRSGLFQALAQSWDEFMRSPQFLESMRQWMDTAVNFRKMTNDFMARVRNELQAPSREDMDAVMLNVRHMEKRLLDRVEELSSQIGELNRRLGNHEVRGPLPGAPRTNANQKTRKPARRKSKSG